MRQRSEALTSLKLGFASFRHHLGENAATAGSLALATAIVAFALGLGSSLHRALYLQAMSGLGRVRNAMVSNRPLPVSVLGKTGWPAIVLSGSLQAADAQKPGGIRVTVLGVDREATKALFELGEGPAENECWISSRAARLIGVRIGDDVLIGLPRFDASPAEAWFRSRTPDATLRTVRFTVAKLLPEPGLAEFSLQSGSRRLPAVVLPRIDASSSWSGRPDAWNAALLDHDPTAELLNFLRREIPDTDLGLRAERSDDHRVGFVHADGPLPELTVDLDVSALPFALLLAESVISEAGRTWYASVAAIDLWELPRDHAAVSSWLARRLGLKAGSWIRLDLLQPLKDGTFRRISASMRVHRVYDERTWLGDPKWTPSIPGLTDADRITDWRAPFPFDARRITPEDETYWRTHRAAPKIILSPDDATGLGLSVKPSSLLLHPASKELEPAVLEKAVASIRRSSESLSLLPLRDLALRSSTGSSDFRLLFVGLSVAVALACLLLAAHSLALAIVRRRRIFGVALAMGVPRRSLHAATMTEVVLLATTGCGAGATLSFFATPMLGRLLESWAGDVAPGLPLRPALLPGEALGALGCLWSVFVLWSSSIVRAELSHGALQLLRDLPLEDRMGITIGWRRKIAPALGLTFLGLSTFISEPIWRSSLGFLASMAAFFLTLPRCHGVPSTVIQLARATLSLHPGHVSASIGTASLAAFLLGTLQSHAEPLSRLDPPGHATAGTEISVQLAIGLPVSPATAAGRRRLGFAQTEERLWQETTWHELGLVEGEDAGCRNAARANTPALVGLPESLLGSGRFDVVSGATEHGRLLIDADTAQWTLKVTIGDELRPAGVDRPLIVSGLLAPSILAGYAVATLPTFRELASSAQPNRWFLVDLPSSSIREATRLLREHLADFGPDVRTTEELWAELTTVQRRYLEAFLFLSLSAWLLLAAGSALQTLRRLHERRSHVALLRSLGVPTITVGAWLCGESVLPAILGALWGAACALASTFPGSSWFALAGAGTAVAVVSVASLAAAFKGLKRHGVLESLRSG